MNSINKPKSKLLKTLVGFLILVVILLIFLGNIQSVFGFLFIATVCTVGIGGVVIIFISYAIGSIFFSIIDKFKDDNQSGSTFLNREENISSALQDYVSKAQASGMKRKEIKENLVNAGWSDEDIKKSL
ncbi:MAG: hypothetical protein CMI53_00995 [Parcubacteria group bacterium]|nr:hypothetical protein [Parcubacteria group bacterium]|tara:strand:- start:18 stop:404 length:387 start_codon:yes stop_codon:yes gene_type:complete